MTEVLSAGERQDLHCLLREWCRQHLHPKTLAEAEAVATEIGRAAAACAFESGAEACGTQAGYQGPQQPCPCGEQARFVGYRRRWVRGLHGEVGLTRAYYHCRACRRGQLPWDQEQGLDEHLFTPTLKAQVTELCARLPYREAKEVFARCCGLTLAESTLEAVTGQVGKALRRTEDAQVQALFEEGTLPSRTWSGLPRAGQRCYLSLDAAKAHTEGAWHDIKVAACYPAEPRGELRGAPGRRQGERRDQAGPSRYLAVQEEAEAFGRRVYTWAVSLGWEEAPEGVVLGDGAEWIWRLAARHFSDAVPILDFFHACEHLWEIARVVFGVESLEGEQWARRGAARLEAQGPEGLLRSLREWRGRGLSTTARQVIGQELRYFRRNRRRMQDPQYRAAGMMIGSGPVEAACKVVVGTRLKRAGMRWSEPGADAVLAARTAVLAGDYEAVARHARAA